MIARAGERPWATNAGEHPSSSCEISKVKQCKNYIIAREEQEGWDKDRIWYLTSVNMASIRFSNSYILSKRSFKLNSLKKQGKKEGKWSPIMDTKNERTVHKKSKSKLGCRPAKGGFKLLEIQPYNHFPFSKVVNVNQTINALL